MICLKLREYKIIFMTRGECCLEDNLLSLFFFFFDKQGTFLIFLAIYFRTLVYKHIVFVVSYHLYIAL